MNYTTWFMKPVQFFDKQNTTPPEKTQQKNKKNDAFPTIGVFFCIFNNLVLRSWGIILERHTIPRRRTPQNQEREPTLTLATNVIKARSAFFFF